MAPISHFGAPHTFPVHSDVIESIKRLSRDAASPTFQQLELNLHRTAAAYVLDLLKEQVCVLDEGFGLWLLGDVGFLGFRAHLYRMDSLCPTQRAGGEPVGLS